MPEQYAAPKKNNLIANLYPSPMTSPHQRLASVDALRGFALLAILLLHNLEHYNLYFTPAWQPAWLNSVDSWLMSTMWFFLAGKAYATFSLLFGFSFFIQMRNARSRGCDFRARFAWRMLILAGFSLFHALFYNGDILLLYAVCGLILIPASGWSDRTVLIVAGALVLQPLEWIHAGISIADPGYEYMNNAFCPYGASAFEVGTSEGLWPTVSNNITNGILYSNLWQIDAGRLCLTPGLFLLGMWLGRKSMFAESALSRRFWLRALGVSVAAAVPLYLISVHVPPMAESDVMRSHLSIGLGRIYDFAFMSALVSAFMVCWFMAKGADGSRFQRSTIAYGRMSLTNYITQSIIGVCIYYNFGLGLYEYTGATGCIIIALGIYAAQLSFSRYWLSRHRQGPFEHLWKRLTWLNATQPRLSASN